MKECYRQKVQKVFNKDYDHYELKLVLVEFALTLQVAAGEDVVLVLFLELSPSQVASFQ